MNNFLLRTNSRQAILKAMFIALSASSVLAGGGTSGVATAQSAMPVEDRIQLPADWRNIKDGVGGYPAGPMLEIALRRTHSDKLEMFKWRSEFIAMLSAQPGPLIEREWHSVSGIPANTGAGTWVGMTWWENQQRWQDMGNMLFTTPVAANWLKTIDMTLIFVKPLDAGFDLHTLAQSGDQVLELGLIVLPSNPAGQPLAVAQAAAGSYLQSLTKSGVETHRFSVYPNPSGFDGPYIVAYNKNGPPSSKGESWFVYMAAYPSLDTRNHLQSTPEIRRTFAAFSNAMIKEHSDIQVMDRTTSEVCIKKATNECTLDPDECHVGVMGSGDTWARSCGERPQACVTGYNVCSQLSPSTCTAVGGKRVDACPVFKN